MTPQIVAFVQDQRSYFFSLLPFSSPLHWKSVSSDQSPDSVGQASARPPSSGEATSAPLQRCGCRVVNKIREIPSLIFATASLITWSGTRNHSSGCTGWPEPVRDRKIEAHRAEQPVKDVFELCAVDVEQLVCRQNLDLDQQISRILSGLRNTRLRQAVYETAPNDG